MPSYRICSPNDLGGRIAREGFDYQDHIGVSFCLDLCDKEALHEVWFEHHDDIVLFWNSGIEIVEMVQVKHENLPSRYSIAVLTRRKEGLGSSLLERSLARSNGCEETYFRIVTSYSVDSELEVLTLTLDDPQRTAREAELTLIKEKINSKCPDINSAPDGTTVPQWVDRCFWDKRQESIQAVKDRNLIRLENILSTLGFAVLSDQRDELYNNLLLMVKQKSGPEGISDYKVTQDYLEEVIKNYLIRQKEGAAGASNLEFKLKEAGLGDFVESARELYIAHRLNTLTNRYSQPKELTEVENEVTAVLSRLKGKMYANEISGGLSFYNLCINELEEIRNKFGKSLVSEASIQGMMYMRTNRCIHRFTRPKV